MPDSRRGRAWLPVLAALVALLAFVPQAGATGYEHEREPAKNVVPVGLFIKAANADEGRVVASIRCTGTDHDGKIVGLAVGPDVDMAALEPGSEIGALIDLSTDPKTIVEVLGDDCPRAEPKPEPKPEREYPKPDPEESDEPEKPVESCSDDDLVARAANGDDYDEEETHPEAGCLPQFVRGFLTRVWKFVGEIDSYEDGELSMTLGKILNVPRKWRTQDDELLDQDATILVSRKVRVFRDGERVAREELDTANDARVNGKLLRPYLWHEDEDGSAVPTIRAKKVYITG